MNALECLNTPFCARLALSLAHFLWEGAVIALAAWGVAAALRRHSSRARYGVYCLALGAMVCALAATILLVEPPRSRNATAPRISQRESGSAAFTERPKGKRDLAAGSFAGPGNVLPGENTGVSPQGAGGAMKSRSESISAPLARWWGAVWPVCAPYVSGAYLVGLLAMMLRLVAALGGSGRLRRLSRPVDDVSVLAALARQAQALGLNFTPPIAFCRRAVVPTVVGILRPTILLPFTFVTGLSADQIEMLLAHELAHVRRWDPLVNVAQRLIEALLFFHPAMWFISRRIRIERELCCDDLVVALGGKPLEYASSLVETASRGRHATRNILLPVESLNAAAPASQLKSRVKRLLGQPEHEALRISRAWVVLCCAAAVGLLAGVLSSGRTPAGEAEPGAESVADFTAAPKASDPPTTAAADARSEPERLVARSAEGIPWEESKIAFDEILKLRETRDAKYVPALEKVLEANVATGRIHGFAAAQALFCIGTPGARSALDRYLLTPRYDTWLAIKYTTHWNMAEPERSGFIKQYYLRNLSEDLAVELAAAPGRDEEGELIAFTITLRNTSGKAFRIQEQQVTRLGRLLSFQDEKGRIAASVEAGSYDLPSRPKWVQLAPGATQQYVMPIHIGPAAGRKGSYKGSSPDVELFAETQNVIFDIVRKGCFQVYAMVEAQPPPKAQLEKLDFDNLWTGRAVSKPIEVDISLTPPVRAVSNPDAPNPPADPVTTDTLKTALEGIRARKALLESKPLRIEYTRTYKFFQPPATFPCVLLAHNGSYKETEKRPGGKEIDRYCYRGFRMEIHRDGEAKGKEAGSAETGSVDNAAKRLSEFRVGDGTSGPGPVNVHTFSLVHWVDETIAREISGEIAGDQRFSLESLEKTMATSLPNSRFEEVGGIRCLRFAEPVEPGADFYAPELGWALLASDRATLKAQDFATVQGFSFPMRMERDAEIIEVRKVEVLDDPAKTDADLTPPAIQRDGAGVVLYTPQWDPKYTTKEGCAKAGGIGHTISPIRWGKDLSPRENRLLIAAASEFYLPALGKAIQTGYPVPYYDVNRDLIVWAKFDRDPGYNVVMHEGDALPEKFGKTPWAVSLDPRVITNPDGSNPPVKTDEGPDSALKNAKNQDPTFNILISRDTPEETARAIKEAAIGQWKALLKRSDLSAAQKTFARWRIGELLSVQYPSSLAEAEQSAPILQTARDSGFLSEEVFNAATLYATSSIEPFERERRLAESYAWLRSISDADIVRNAPLINRYGYLIALKFFVPEKADITDPPVPEREKWLRDRLADARKTLETSIGENIESSRKRAPVLYLLAGLRNVADPEQLARWRSMPSRYASEWESEAEAWKTIDTMLKDGPHEGVQVRLKTEKSVWKADEQPVFKIDLKSEKERILPHYGPPLDDFDVRLDGVWYRRNKSGERQENLRSLGPSPGTSRENVGFLLRPDFWCRSDDKITTMPSLAPGKHTLEVALPLDSADKATSQPLRAVSNPVEIEIAEKSVSLLGQIHDVLRKVRGSGTDFDAREKELLALLNDYTDPKDIGAIYAACARIHYGTGSTHFDRLVKYARKSLEYPLDLEARMMACMRWGEGLQMQGGGSAADLPRQPREEIVKPFLRAIRLTLDAGIPEQPVAVPKLTATRVGGGMVGLDPEVEKRMKKEYDAQIGAIEEATRTNKIIVLRKFHEEKIVALYSQKPLATEELRQIATEIIGNPTVVSNLIARVNERIEEKSWGEAVSGVQIRLRDAKPARGDGVTSPVLLLLKADATNTGNLLLHLAENGNYCQVEVDGQWYMWFPDSALRRIGEVKRDGDGDGKGSDLLDFGGGKRYTDLSVTIGSEHWRALPAGRAEEIAALEWGNAFLAYRPEDIGAAMRLAPGKHRIRVAYNCGSARAGQDIGSVRAVSNPLEVEIP